MSDWRTSYLGRSLVVAVLLVMVHAKTGSSSASATIPVSAATQIRENSLVAETLIQGEPAFSLGSTEMIVRFFFVRHGQTEANDNLIVVGQGDSPLTALGIQQAEALGRTDLIREERFWRRYSSDLGRAERTTRLILGRYQKDLETIDSLGVRLDPRLREVAKGAREGLSKRMSYQEAKIVFRQKHSEDEPLPLQETEEVVWERFQDWLMNVVGDAVREQRRDPDRDGPTVFSVFVVSHAGTLRTALKYLVPEQLPASVDLTPQGADGSTSRHLNVPNTSVTIVDLSPREVTSEIWDGERHAQRASASNLSELWHAKLQQLTWTDHYQQMQE